MLGGLVILVGQTLSVTAEAQPQRTPTVLTIHWGAEDAPSTPVIDAAMYWFVPKITVCYRCRREFRDRPLNPEHEAFELAVAEKYRGKDL